MCHKCQIASQLFCNAAKLALYYRIYFLNYIFKYTLAISEFQIVWFKTKEDSLETQFPTFFKKETVWYGKE
jgi:hypothetical protein